MEDTEENYLYVNALKSLEKHGKTSEHVKVAETPKEIDFMRETNRLVYRKSITINYSENQFEKIFGNNYITCVDNNIRGNV